jgi:hypothetical protein
MSVSAKEVSSTPVGSSLVCPPTKPFRARAYSKIDTSIKLIFSDITLVYTFCNPSFFFISKSLPFQVLFLVYYVTFIYNSMNLNSNFLHLSNFYVNCHLYFVISKVLNNFLYISFPNYLKQIYRIISPKHLLQPKV